MAHNSMQNKVTILHTNKVISSEPLNLMESNESFEPGCLRYEKDVKGNQIVSGYHE